MIKVINLLPSGDILHNRGCGISYLQRNHKVKFTDVPETSWFLQENLCRQIAIDAPWCLLEPEEGKYTWQSDEWEGCFDSWVQAGYKVNLQIRGMDTAGTLYDQGTPQWVFDLGAKYIDDPIQIYRKEAVLLNDIPAGNYPIRYPVYWDPIYKEKAEKFIHEFGARYNGKSFVEGVTIGFVGRWGEMHLGDWGPMEPWFDRGFSKEGYVKNIIWFIDVYRKAFPDTPITLEMGKMAFYPEYSYQDVQEVFEYAASKGVQLKYNGLGNSFEPESSPYLCKSIIDFFKKYKYMTKLRLENLALPDALEEALGYGISYWQRGGETPGLGIMRITDDCPIVNKRIFSWYSFFGDNYDRLTVEQQKDAFRMMAKKCGYRLGISRITIDSEFSTGSGFTTEINWNNNGNAPCYEKFDIVLALYSYKENKEVWRCSQKPANGFSPKTWDASASIVDTLKWHIPPEVTQGEYELRIGVQLHSYGQEMMKLDIDSKMNDGLYSVGTIAI